MRVPVGKLTQISFALLKSYGLSDDDATIVADSFIEADLVGVNTHGVTVLPAHLDKLARGGYNIRAEISVLKRGGSFAVVDGNNLMGPISAYRAMQIAIDEARDKGAYLVFSRNNNTFGPAFYYSTLASKQGLIGIAMCNTPAAMAPWGGKDKLLGTNPLTIAIPGPIEGPILLDMATSAVAKSKINLARIEEREIPLGWATDSDGIPTRDPMKAITGLVMPMAEYKGYGLSLMIDILAGVLSGAAFLDGVGGFYREQENGMNVGCLFIALNPEEIYGGGFDNLIATYVEKIQRSSSVNEERRVILPGENKIKKREENLRLGIEVHTDTVVKINEHIIKKNLDFDIFA